MNKTAIKNFAIWARNKLIADISYRAGLMGITADGIHAALPQSTGQTEFYDIGTVEPFSISGEAIQQRRHLVELIKRKEKETNYKTAYKYVIEEVAYTWFNRLIAVRFMEVNDYLPSHIRVLSSDTGKMEPDLVTTPFDAELEFTRSEQQMVVDMKNENKLDEVFRLLFIKQCNALNEILPALFEKTNDYTELLLNLSVIDQDGVVYHLVHDIPEEDFNVERGGQVEIIGWLYQYYNTEQNELVYDGSFSSEKIKKELLPAATTIYTPDWAVRNMVENSLGRLWLEGHPNEELKSKWKYYLEEPEQEKDTYKKLLTIRNEYSNLKPVDIKLIDPCMGSGHILVYAFDVLMQIYENAGYGKRDATRCILEKNLYGLDIDDRAFQIAYFAVMMKARQHNRRILNGEYKPNLYPILESNGINRNQLKFFGKGMNDKEKKAATSQCKRLLDIFYDAKEYGSILKVEDYDLDLLYRFVSSIEEEEQLSIESVGLNRTQEELLGLLSQSRVLANKYHVVITNPPYLGNARFDAKLDAYVKKHYVDVKSDLSMVMYMKAMEDFSLPNGMISFITTSAWMFLTSFEKLRTYVNSCKTITSLVDYGSELFEGKVGHNLIVSWVTRNSNIDYRLNGVRLVDYCYSRRDEKEPEYFNPNNYYTVTKAKLSSIPGHPFAYWVSDKFIEAFKNGESIEAYSSYTASQNKTADNNKYLRLFWEVSNINDKWLPYSKGGDFRRWYGNISYVVDWSFEAREFYKCNPTSNLLAEKYWNQEGISYSDVTSYKSSFRWFDGGAFDMAGPCITYIKDSMFFLGILNTAVFQYYKELSNPTIHCQAKDVKGFPFLMSICEKDRIRSLADSNVKISRLDWDSFETSRDFKRNPLIQKDVPLSSAFAVWVDECKSRFTSLRQNEEELNRILLKEYGLNDEIDYIVEEKDITVRLADLNRDIRGLISYAVGCMLGRYSLDSDGIVYAGGVWDDSKYKTYMPDDDNIIPITDEEYLEDDVVNRFCEWLKVVYGSETLEENLDFIANALGNKGNSSREIIRNYFLTDFFKDHCQTYSVTGSGKRPIYWLFSSGKQNGFKALIYLHRYDADTIGNLRIDYLHRMQRVYESEINRMQDMIDHSTSAREAVLATKRREKLTKQLKECREYDEKMAHLALSRIELDLDDGVKVNYRKLQTANDGKFYEVLADSKSIMAKK